jgi:hypothetical protein
MAVDDATGITGSLRNSVFTGCPPREHRAATDRSRLLPPPDPTARLLLVVEARRTLHTALAPVLVTWAAVDPQDAVDLLLGEGAVARGCGHHQLTDELDLPLEGIVGELPTGVRFCGHDETLTESAGTGVTGLPSLDPWGQ